MVLTILLYYYISSILCEKGGGPACRATIAVPHYIRNILLSTVKFRALHAS